MEHDRAAHAFATLGHPGRLAVARLLMRFAPRAVRPTEIAQALGLKPNTLSHYLSDLTGCGLVAVRRKGRSLLYSIDVDATGRLLGYLAMDLGRARPDVLTSIPQSKEPTVTHTGFHVLFICSGNSARSLYAEALLRDLGGDRFIAHSAGTRAGTHPNPLALQVLDRNGHDTTTLRSKHLSEFQSPDAPRMDFVFTVCDTSASEECPPWPGQPITGHWGLPDPVKAQGTDAERALVFARTYAALRRRIEAFAALPVASLDRISLQNRVDQIDARELARD